MEGLIAALSVLLPALVCVLVPLIWFRSSSKLRLPPGPRGLPFIGHLHMLGSTNPHQSLSLLSKAYGPLMSLRFGSVPVVVASTPAMARHILQAQDQTFASRTHPAVAIQVHGCADIAFSQPNPYWKLMRQIFVTDLVSNKRLQSFRALITDEMHVLLRAILADMANEVPVRAKLYTATSNIMSRISLHKRLADVLTRPQSDPSYSLVSLLMEAVNLTGVFNVGDYIPALAWIDLHGCVRRSKAIGQKLHVVLQEVIDTRREMRRKSNNIASEDLDFLDVLMTAASESKAIHITDFNIMAILIDILIGGIGTSSITVEWALGELLTNPIKMKNVQDELEQVVGMSRLPNETDIPHLPYLRAVVKETMRLHPPAPLLLPHKASKECHIAGYDIPSGTLAYVNVWEIGRDPGTWERPLEFWPERFLDCTTDVHGQHFELLPFGSGRRSCPGWSLGLSNVQYMLASILHGFNWSTTERPNLSEKFGLVLALENPLVAKAIPRVSNLLFE